MFRLDTNGQITLVSNILDTRLRFSLLLMGILEGTHGVIVPPRLDADAFSL